MSEMDHGRFVAGVDEVGRGPLAGSVFAAAVILGDEYPFKGIADSKSLSEKKREALYTEITEHCVAWAIGEASVEEIEELNILQASLLAMQRAVRALIVVPSKVLVDGHIKPQLDYPTVAVIDGDKTVREISAASIIAKVSRDRVMVQLDGQYPGYGFAQHKGYGTVQHMAALAKLGPTDIHRRSFAPVKEALACE